MASTTTLTGMGFVCACRPAVHTAISRREEKTFTRVTIECDVTRKRALMESPLTLDRSEPGLPLVRQVLLAELLLQYRLFLARAENLHRDNNGEEQKQPRVLRPHDDSQEHEGRENINGVPDARINAGGDQNAGLGAEAEGAAKLQPCYHEQCEGRGGYCNAGDAPWCPWHLSHGGGKDNESYEGDHKRNNVQFQSLTPFALAVHESRGCRPTPNDAAQKL